MVGGRNGRHSESWVAVRADESLRSRAQQEGPGVFSPSDGHRLHGYRLQASKAPMKKVSHLCQRGLAWERWVCGLNPPRNIALGNDGGVRGGGQSR